MLTKLFIGCSSSKKKLTGPAREVYGGTLFRASLAYGEHFGYEVIIISAKYGYITAETIIEPYDIKLTRDTTIPIREDSGYHLLSTHYAWLVPNCSFPPNINREGGKMGFLLQVLKRVIPFWVWQEKVKGGGRDAWKEDGLVTEMAYLSSTGWYDIYEILIHLIKKFGDPSGVLSTIKTQLGPTRLSKQRRLYLYRKGDKYHLSETPILKQKGFNL